MCVCVCVCVYIYIYIHTQSEYREFVGKPKRMRPLGSLRCRWDGNVRIDLQEIEWEGIEWIDVDQDRGSLWAAMNTVMKIRFP